KMEFFKKHEGFLHPAPSPTDDPPPQPAISVAEWEPATGVLICYPLEIPLGLVAELSEDVEVITFLADEARRQQALRDYSGAGVDTSNCSFVFTGADWVPWTRDFGPWYIFDGNDEQGLIDNLYPWPNIGEELLPQILGDTLDIPVYETGLWLEGGNYMTDGMGNAITVDYTYFENEPLTPEEIDGYFEEYLGITNHITVPDPFWYFVPHIDCHAKLLDPGRILVIETGNQVIEENVAYYQTLMSGYGRPYEIVRMPGLGYCNSLILNDKVFVALSDSPGDSLAMLTWQEAMPGYEVMGFSYPGFWFLDALHCRTHEAHDRYMLRIVHVPVHDSENTGGGYYLEAEIHPYSNEPLVGPPVIMWKTEGGTYSPAAMTSVGDDIYAGEIPPQPDGTYIYYYIEAEDATGRVEHHPHIADGNPHHFFVGPDNEPPVVEFDPPTSIMLPEWPYTFTTYALDNRWISAVTMEWSVNGVAQVDVDLPLEEPYAVFYTGTVTGTIQPGDVIEARVKAVDTSTNQNTTYSPYFTIAIDSAPEIDIIMELVSIPVIPPEGGTLVYNLMLINGDTVPLSFDAWLDLTYESGFPTTLIQRYLTDFQPGQMISRPNMLLPIPTNYPAGMYFLGGKVGAYPDLIWSEDNLPFTKEGVSNGVAFKPWITEGITDPFIIADNNAGIINDHPLVEVYPNPFNPTTVLSYQLSGSCRINLTVYDITGRKVVTLVDGFRDAGNHKVQFDGSNLASGVYLYRLTTDAVSLTGKMVLMK
ncbi:agmatine deiminase family protein, partial [bacterium]|nr:agmatine deiminase family protein [bacterium]